MSQIPPISSLYAIAEHRAQPEPFESEFPPFQYATQGSQVDHARSMPSNLTQDFLRGPPPEVPTHTLQNPVPQTILVRGPGLDGQSQGFPSFDGVIYPDVAYFVVNEPHSWSYIAKLRTNKSVIRSWSNDLLNDLAFIERDALFRNTASIPPRLLEYWKSWVDLHRPGLIFRDKTHKINVIENSLNGYDWFVGESMLFEAIMEMCRFERLLRARFEARGIVRLRQLAQDGVEVLLEMKRWKKVREALAQTPGAAIPL
jgi:hypothetical protein